MRRLRDCVILAVTCLFVAGNVRADQTVARIQCPTETKAKVKWPDRIHDDPTYSREQPPDEWITFVFKEMKQTGQEITCTYKFSGSAVKNYGYTAKRKISTCKRVDARTIDCFLE